MPHASFKTSAPGMDEQGLKSEIRPSLEWLISPISKQQYFAEYWEARPLVIKRDNPDYFSSLLSLNEVDRILTTLDRRYPDVCLKNADKPIMAGEYSSAGGVLDIAKIYQLFQEGSTITLAYLDTVVPALTVFCRTLENEFNFPFQTNVYLTPAGAQGAQRHYDTHDVFVLQIAGSKRWTIFETPVESPLAGQDYDPTLHNLGAPTLEFELNAGDMAYIPRGVGHQARSTDAVSLHITAGILRYTWAELLLELIARASLNDSSLRKALPPGFARPDFDRVRAQETARRLLQQAWTASNFDAALDSVTEAFLSACPPSLEGQMAQLATLDCLSPDGVVGVRPGVVFRLQANGEADSVDCYGRTITFPAHVRDAVRFALSQPRFIVRDLPGNLDDTGKLTLIRRLIREGLLWAV
jgi:ribosomal protein L16 Arg81 hydroxylase